MDCYSFDFYIIKREEWNQLHYNINNIQWESKHKTLISRWLIFSYEKVVIYWQICLMNWMSEENPVVKWGPIGCIWKFAFLQFDIIWMTKHKNISLNYL